MMHSIAENLVDGTSVEHELWQRLLADLQPGSVKQTRSASLPHFASLLVPHQPSHEIR